MLATMAALRNTRVPAYVIDEDAAGKVILTGGAGIPLAVTDTPLACCFGVFDGKLLADLTSEEERVVTSQMSIVTNDAGKLCSVFKSGGAPVPPALLRSCVDAAAKRAVQLRSALGCCKGIQVINSMDVEESE